MLAPGSGGTQGTREQRSALGKPVGVEEATEGSWAGRATERLGDLPWPLEPRQGWRWEPGFHSFHS